MRVVVTGCGSIGSRHARNAKFLGHDVFVSDIDPVRAEACARELRVSVVTGDSPWPEALLICTPASTHAAVARELHASGYRGPLFVEKPLARSPDDCDIFHNWPHQTTMVGYNWRFHPQMREWKIRFAPMSPDGIFLTCQTDMALWPGRAYDDPLLECSHEIDTALWMGADPVVGSAEYIIEQPGFTLSIGHRAIVRLLWAHADPLRSVKGLRRCEQIKKTHACYCCTHDVAPLTMRDSVNVDISYRYEVEHFLGCAQRGAPTETPFSDGIRVLDVIDQARLMVAA